ncbi:MAG: hypothetical protein GF309_07060 [Candidatus Lokiarchaeota archaeon]|nr:hypothetical protein [Candidatus Lokiarchaeota archaeon]
MRHKYTILVLILLAVFVIPLPRSDAAQTTEERLGIPQDAKRYYDSKGRLSGAVRNNPHIPELIPLDESYDSEHDLPEVDIVRFENGIKLDYYRDGKLIRSQPITQRQLQKQMGCKRAGIFLKSLEDPNITLSRDPINNLKPRPDRLGASWVKKEEREFDRWVKIGEICSETYLDVKLELEFSAGTERALSVELGPIQKYDCGGFSTSSISPYWASNGGSWTIYYKFLYKYEYWELQHNWWPWIVYSTHEEWYPDAIYDLSGDYRAPYPDIGRSKSSHDNWLTLHAYAWKQKKYQDFDETGFGFDVGVTLTGQWHGWGGEIELASFSDLEGHYEQTTAVYTFYSNDDAYHEWAVYNWGWSSGTQHGWGLTFDLRS